MSTTNSARPALSVPTIVEAARELLGEGGPEAVVIREVARRLDVTAPALYKHVAGREELLTQLIANCLRELSARCAEAAAAAEDPLDRLRAAAAAFREWALGNTAEFGLLYGIPIIGYHAPEDGPTVVASRQLGEIFIQIFVDLDEQGRLLVDETTPMPEAVRESLEAKASQLGRGLTVPQLYCTAVGWQRMLGLVSVEVVGHLDWAFAEPAEYAAWQLHMLMPDMVALE